jgi:hypothetical protein
LVAAIGPDARADMVLPSVRAKKLVKAFSVERPCYRLLLRDQLLATGATAAAASPPTSGNERLKKFTIELIWTGADAMANALTWVGHLQATPPHGDVGSGVGCQLLDAALPPKWAAGLNTALDNWYVALQEEERVEEAEAAHEVIATATKTNLRTRMLVSELTPTGMPSLLLCEDEEPDQDSDMRTGDFGLFDYKELALTSFASVSARAADVPDHVYPPTFRTMCTRPRFDRIWTSTQASLPSEQA